MCCKASSCVHWPWAHSRLIPICNAFFIQRGHRRSLPILRIGEESDGGHRIKRALYIGIKRLCMGCILALIQAAPSAVGSVRFNGIFRLWRYNITYCVMDIVSPPCNLVLDFNRYANNGIIIAFVQGYLLVLKRLYFFVVQRCMCEARFCCH